MSAVDGTAVARGQSRLVRIGKHAISFIVIIGVWELAGQLGQLNKLILPWPSLIGDRLWSMFFVRKVRK